MKIRYFFIFAFYLFLLFFCYRISLKDHTSHTFLPKIKNTTHLPAPYQKYHTADYNSTCKEFYPNFLFNCNLSKSTEPTIVLFGDSHMNMYYNSFVEKLKSDTVMTAFNASCFPFSSFYFTDFGCQKTLDQFKNFISKTSSIHTIVLSGYFSYLTSGFKYGNYDGKRVANDLDNDHEVKMIKSAKNVLDFLKESKKKIIIITEIPDMVFSISECFEVNNNKLIKKFRNHKKKRDKCYISRDDYEKRNKPFELLLLNILKKYPEIKVFDPKSILCDKINCYAINDGYNFYYDSDHLTSYASNLIFKNIIYKSFFK